MEAVDAGEVYSVEKLARISLLNGPVWLEGEKLVGVEEAEWCT